MATIVEIRYLRDQGLSKRAVAKRLHLSRDTVAKYWEGASDPERPRYKTRTRLIDPYTDYIIKRLAKYPELSAHRLFKEILSLGYQGSERSVRRYVQTLRPQVYREYKPVETLPGEQAQVDWGNFGTIQEEGAWVKLYAFTFTLAWSRVSYVEYVTSLDTATFLACLHRALVYVGGVPREILFDNAKTVVSERVGGVVRFNEDLLRMGIAYGFTPRACWVQDPESKGKVESQIKYLRRSFFYGTEFKDRQELNQKVRVWCDREANARVHGTTGAVPWERLDEERLSLKPLPEVVSLPYVVEKRQASRTSLISVAGNYYSVPARWARQTVRFRRFEDHLELLDGQEIVETIPLVPGRGRRIIREEHYPAHCQAQKRQVPSRPLQARFEVLAPQARAYLEGLSRTRTGHLREQMQQIIALAELYAPSALSQAMERALAYQAFGYGSLKRILERQQTTPQSLPEQRKDIASTPLRVDLDVQVERRTPAYYQRWEGGR